MNTFDTWALSLIVFVPALGMAVIMLIPRREETAQKVVALLATLTSFGVSLAVLARFDYDQTHRLQFAVNKEWIPVIHSRFHIGIDGISLPLLVLSTFITVLCVIYSWNHWPEPHNPKAFLALMMLLEVGMNGTFVAEDLILFFVFFEIVLLPMFFMIGVWGGPNRRYASIKFFLFTLFGSALMLLAFLALFFLSPVQTFSIPALSAFAGQSISHNAQNWIFAGMFLGFAIKVPMFPFHTWLPDAHTEAPTVGSVLLAAILLKLGTYGFIRIALPVLPDAAKTWAPWIGLLAVIGIIYGALGCLAQKDMKRLIAFSSVAHMGFVMLGISTLTSFGINAAIFGMVAHGLITGMLFFIAGSVQHNFETREMDRLGGLLVLTPKMGWILGFCAMASLGLPGLAGFWGEFPAILSTFDPLTGLSLTTFRTYMVIAAIGTVLAAGYLLWMFQKVAFGNPKPEFANAHVHDVTVLEWIAWTPILVLIVFLGVYPNALFRITDGAVTTLTTGMARAIGRLILPPTTNPVFDWHALAPEIVLVGAIVAVLLADLAWRGRAPWRIPQIASIGVLAAMVPVITLAADGTDRSMFDGAFVVDSYTLILTGFFLMAAYIAILLSIDYIGEGDYYKGEYYFLILSSVLGMCVMAGARDLVTLFVALELISLPTYVLAGFRKHDRGSNEAAIKYYIIGVLSSAIMLYGFSIIYGIAGSTQLTQIARAVSETNLPNAPPLLAVAIFLSLIGFAFKVSAVPFHFWAPDTYVGAPTPVTAFLSVASKAGGFVAMLNIVFFGFASNSDAWWPVIWVLAAASMTLGNLAALRQTNMVRMLAYSSIAQGGFILVPFAAAGSNPSSAGTSFSAVVIYLLIYGAMNFGAFACVIAVARRTGSAEITSYNGLFYTSPAIAVAFTIFLGSLAGIPPFAGWFAKFVMFGSVIEAGGFWAISLGVIAAVNSVIAFFYYSAPIRAMFFEQPADATERSIKVPAALVVAIGLTVTAVVVVGVYPEIVANLGDKASDAVTAIAP